MANKLRWRLILASMSALLVVMCAITLAINLANFATVRQNADAVLDTIALEGGTFRDFRQGEMGDTEPPLPPNDEYQGEGLPQKQEGAPDFERDLPNRNGRWIDQETPFETRFFTVVFNEDGATAYLDRIAAIDEQEALAMAQNVRQKGGTYGYYRDYRYKIVGDNMVIFVDCSKQLYTARQFLYTSLYVSAAALVAMFVLVFVFSRYAVAPIVKAYDKQKRFITEASHELKTPLTIISANNELQELESGETQSTIAIDKQVKRMTQMVKNMVALSRLDETETLQDVVLFSLSDSLADTVDAMRAALSAQGRTLDVNIQDGVALKGNEQLVRQLLSILLENAAKYAETHTAITLTKSHGAILTVANDAKDLPDGDMSQCFERFYRSPIARESAEGSGIGLSIARQIAALHRADISAYAKDGVFTVTVAF